MKPDLYVVSALGDDEWHRYVEVDRSTESLKVLVEKKARAYEEYVATGADQAHLGIVPQVLWLVPDKVRAQRFRAALASARNLSVRLHQIITADKLEAEFLGQIAATFGPKVEERGS